MAVVMTSPTQTADEIAAAFTSNGLTSEGERNAKPAVEPAAPASPSVPPAKPGESSQAEPQGESAPAPEAGETKPQGEETTPAKPEAKAEPAAEPAKPAQPKRGDFESKRIKLERERTLLQDQLELERGSKTKLAEQLAAAEAELAKLKPAEPVKKDEGPVRPKRPTLADCDFDQDKLDAALDQHEERLGQYYADLSAKQVEAQETKRAEDRKAEEKQKAVRAQFDQFVERKEAGRKGFDDWDEVFEELGSEGVPLTDVSEAFILRSKHPAELLHYFATDALAGAKELGRISTLDPFDQVSELKDLEVRLVAERKAATKAAKQDDAPVVAAEEPAKPEVTQPVKQTPKPVKVEDPIDPVGSRAAAKTATLGDAKSVQDYIRMRRQGLAS